jgi:hypothetical protein
MQQSTPARADQRRIREQLRNECSTQEFSRHQNLSLAKELPMNQTIPGGKARQERPGDLQRDDRGAGHTPQRSKKDIDDELDKALKDSFPSSDPPAASQPTNTEPAGDPDVKP